MRKPAKGGLGGRSCDVAGGRVPAAILIGTNGAEL